jgi:hypothetical protein
MRTWAGDYCTTSIIINQHGRYWDGLLPIHRENHMLVTNEWIKLRIKFEKSQQSLLKHVLDLVFKRNLVELCVISSVTKLERVHLMERRIHLSYKWVCGWHLEHIGLSSKDRAKNLTFIGWCWKPRSYTMTWFEEKKHSGLNEVVYYMWGKWR